MQLQHVQEENRELRTSRASVPPATSRPPYPLLCPNPALALTLHGARSHPSPKLVGGRAQPASGSAHTREPLELPTPAAQRAVGVALCRRQEGYRAAPPLPLSYLQRRRVLVRAPLPSPLGGRQRVDGEQRTRWR